MKKIFFAWLVLFPFFTKAQTTSEIFKTAVGQMERYLDGPALMNLSKVIEKEPNHYEALWRACVLKTRIANRITDSKQQMEYLKAAVSLADKAMLANPNDAEGYFAWAFSKGREAIAITSPKEKLAAAIVIKERAEMAVKLNPKHAAAWHILGGWNYNVANLNVAERAACNLLFGGVPKGASNEKALECYKVALANRPNFIFYMYDMAECFYTMRKMDECKKLLNEMLATKPFTPDDPATLAKARVLLARCG